jgi:pimeloyl-ACP methyl ester carboxylesterase
VRVPVHVWHGERDETVPLAMAHHLASEIPGATLRLSRDDGHHLLYRRWPEILAALR